MGSVEKLAGACPERDYMAGDTNTGNHVTKILVAALGHEEQRHFHSSTVNRRSWPAMVGGPCHWRIIAATSVKNIITHAIYLCGRAGYSLSSAVVRLFPTIASLQSAVRTNSFDGRSPEGRNGVDYGLARLFTHISPRADIGESRPLRWLFGSLGRRRSGTSLSWCTMSPLIVFP